MDAHVGDGFQPVARRRMQCGPGRQLQAAQEVFLDELHRILDASFFVRPAHSASADFQTVVVGKIQVAWIELSGLAQRMAQHGGLAVIDHDASGHALEETERLFVAAQELFLALTQGELDVEHPAVTEHTDKEAKPPAGRTERNGAPTAPIDLETFARSELEGKEGFDRFGPNQAHILRHDRIADRHALGLQPLEHLLGAQVVRLQPTLDQRLVRIELARAPRPLRLVKIVFEPVADGFLVQLKLLGNLAYLQLLLVAQGTNLAIDGVINHS